MPYLDAVRAQGGFFIVRLTRSYDRSGLNMGCFPEGDLPQTENSGATVRLGDGFEMESSVNRSFLAGRRGNHDARLACRPRPSAAVISFISEIESNSRTVTPKHQVKPTTTNHQNTGQNS